MDFKPSSIAQGFSPAEKYLSEKGMQNEGMGTDFFLSCLNFFRMHQSEVE